MRHRETSSPHHLFLFHNHQIEHSVHLQSLKLSDEHADAVVHFDIKALPYLRSQFDVLVKQSLSWGEQGQKVIIVAPTKGQVKRILEYCELGWEDACLRFHETSRPVKSASSEQVRRPIYSGAVNTWRHYEPHLGALIEVLEPVLKELPESDRPTCLGGSAA